MNNLQKYVWYVQPVIQAIREHHNEFCNLQYLHIDPEDLFAEGGLIEFRDHPTKYLPGHFDGELPVIHASWGEESGSSLLLEISPEHRERLSPEVVDVLEWPRTKLGKWAKTAKKTIYVPLDHEYYLSGSGFVPPTIPSTEVEDWEGIGHGLDFLSHRLGLNYLTVHAGICDLEAILD